MKKGISVIRLLKIKEGELRDVKLTEGEIDDDVGGAEGREIAGSVWEVGYGLSLSIVMIK